MNGLVDINVGGSVHTLSFGVHGCAEFERLCYLKPSTNTGKLLTDMLHGGRYGHAIRNGLAEPEYKDSALLLEVLSEQEDYLDQIHKVQKVWQESKFGRDFIKRNEAFKKKMEELNQ